MVEDRRAREYRQHQWMTQHDALDGAFSLLLSYQGFPPAIHLRHLEAASRGPLHWFKPSPILSIPISQEAPLPA